MEDLPSTVIEAEHLALEISQQIKVVNRQFKKLLRLLIHAEQKLIHPAQRLAILEAGKKQKEYIARQDHIATLQNKLDACACDTQVMCNHCLELGKAMQKERCHLRTIEEWFEGSPDE